MKENIEKLESLLESKYENWTIDTLVKVVETPELKNLLTPEVATFLAENKINDGINNIMVPIKYGFYIRKMKGEIEVALESLNEKKISEDGFKTVINKLINGTTIEKMGGYLAMMTIFPDEKVNKELIQKALDETFDIVENIDLTMGMEVVLEFLDLIFPVRELYFKQTQEDLVSDKSRLEKILVAIDEQTNLFTGQEESSEENTEEIPPTE